MFLTRVTIYLRPGCGALPKSEHRLRQAKVLDHFTAIAWFSKDWCRVREVLDPLQVVVVRGVQGVTPGQQRYMP